MPDGRLVIGNRRYSSWSLRGWLAVRLAGLDVEEVVIPLEAGPSAAVAAATPAGLVPYLEHKGARVWESIAIAEYCAEQGPPGLWPEDRVLRAHARAAAAEMHAGFRALRQSMPMNLGREFPGGGRDPESLADIARVEAVWREARAASGGAGPFLFGDRFGLADAMYAPVVTRFRTYKIDLEREAEAYCAAILALPAMQEWVVAARNEPMIVEAFEF
jgi:glutathione S-transferase